MKPALSSGGSGRHRFSWEEAAGVLGWSAGEVQQKADELHLNRSARADAVRLTIDQCAEVGFEMAGLTFGSGFDFESRIIPLNCPSASPREA